MFYCNTYRGMFYYPPGWRKLREIISTPHMQGERERVNCDIKNAEKRMIELEAELEELEKKQTEQANLTECEIGESMSFPSPYCPV